MKLQNLDFRLLRQTFQKVLRINDGLASCDLHRNDLTDAQRRRLLLPESELG